LYIRNIDYGTMQRKQARLDITKQYEQRKIDVCNDKTLMRLFLERRVNQGVKRTESYEIMWNNISDV